MITGSFDSGISDNILNALLFLFSQKEAFLQDAQMNNASLLMLMIGTMFFFYLTIKTLYLERKVKNKILEADELSF